MKKKDFLIIVIFVITAVILWLLFNRMPGEITNGEVVVYKDRRVIEVIPLTAEKTVVIEDENGNRNVVQVEGGKARIVEANCRDQICVNTRSAQANGQSIICLPNRVAVEIRSTRKNEIDGVSE